MKKTNDRMYWESNGINLKEVFPKPPSSNLTEIAQSIKCWPPAWGWLVKNLFFLIIWGSLPGKVWNSRPCSVLGICAVFTPRHLHKKEILQSKCAPESQVQDDIFSHLAKMYSTHPNHGYLSDLTEKGKELIFRIQKGQPDKELNSTIFRKHILP